MGFEKSRFALLRPPGNCTNIMNGPIRLQHGQAIVCHHSCKESRRFDSFQPILQNFSRIKKTRKWGSYLFSVKSIKNNSLDVFDHFLTINVIENLLILEFGKMAPKKLSPLLRPPCNCTNDI